MIRINDHLFRADLIMHMQILTDGTSYVVSVEYGNDKVLAIPFFDRDAAELALEQAQAAITAIIVPWDDDEEDIVL